MDAASVAASEDAVETLHAISRILDTGLDRETLRILIGLCEAGVNPEALAAIVKELRREAAALGVAASGGAPMLKQLGIGHQAARPALLGAEASEYVGSLLRSKGPDIAVHELQAGYSLQHPLCRPLLIMMDTMQVSRREVHLHVLNRARRLLLDWIAAARAASEARAADMRPDAPEPPEELELQERLERLLNASFKYMGVPELKQVPMEVMSTMTHVPAPYLKQLAEDREIFNELPSAVKQQVYEHDRNLLQQDAAQHTAAYKYELGTVMAALNLTQYLRRRPRTSSAEAAAAGVGSTGSAELPAAGSGAAAAAARGIARQGPAGLPRPGGRAVRGGRGRGGFSVASVLSAVGRDMSGQAAAAPGGVPGRQQQPPGAHGLVPPRMPGGGSRSSSAAAAALLPSRKTVRSGSEAIKHLRDMVGGSSKVYGHLVELCEVRLKESTAPYMGTRELSYCALRTQLLMALRDAGGRVPGVTRRGGQDFVGGLREQLPREERTHELVWLLDGALLQHRLTLQHMRRLAELFEAYMTPPSRFLEEQQQEDAAAAAAARSPERHEQQRRGPGARAGPAAMAKRLSEGTAQLPVGSARKRQRLAGSGGRGDGGGVRRGGFADGAEYERRRAAEDAEALAHEMAGFITPDGADALDAEDACGGGGASAARRRDRWLGDAGMVLRDPPTMHLLAAEVASTLHWCLASGRLPRDVPQLPWLLRLMALAAGTRTSLREGTYAMPPAPTEQLHSLWPELLVLLAEGEVDAAPWDQDRERPLGQVSGERHENSSANNSSSDSSSSDGWQLVASEYSRQEVVRHVVQALVLERLHNGDLVTARALLQLMLASRHLSSAAAVPEYAAFAYSLASLVQDLVRARVVTAGSGFWQVAVGDVLLALVDAHAQVHLEVLRLLLLVCKELTPDTLAAYLAHMLEATAASRARTSSQKRKFAHLTQHSSHGGYGAHGVPGYIATGGAASEWSDGFRAVRSLKYGGSSDGYSQLYRKLLVVGGLSDKQQLWPQPLARYMQGLEARRQEEEAARRAEREAANSDDYAHDDEDDDGGGGGGGGSRADGDSDS